MSTPNDEGNAANRITVAEEQQLLLRARDGDRAALGELYQLHHSFVVVHARRYLNDPTAADDLAQDAFVATCDAMRRGKGPQHSFGHYWMTAVRSIAIQQNIKAGREVLTDTLEDFVPDAAAELPVQDTGALDAFLSLSERRRQAVWLRTVQGYSVTEAAELMGLSAAAFSVLYHRAKEDMRLSFLLSIDPSSLAEGCQPFFELLPAAVRNSLSAVKRKRLEAHLETCESCSTHRRTMMAVATRFVGVLPIFGILPIVPDPAALSSQAAVIPRGRAGWLTNGKVLAVLGAVALAATAAVLAVVAFTGAPSDNTSSTGSGENVQVLTVAGPTGDCSVEYVRGARADAHFVVSNTTGAWCSVGIGFDGGLVREPVAVHEYELVMAPREGTYSFSVETPDHSVVKDFITAPSKAAQAEMAN